MAARKLISGILFIIFFSFVFQGLSASPDREEMIDHLKNLSLEELLELRVTTVSRKEEQGIKAAASLHLITEEDIRRSGARSIPEALRLAPNLQVAQTGSRGWAISARGFNASFANKLLVLIDGRT